LTTVRRLTAELVGTFALVFAGCSAVMVEAKTGALGHVGVAITFGLVIMLMIYPVGHVSGAHLNPAVSLAFALSRHFPWTNLFGYWAAQLAGALAAAAILRGSLGNIAHVGATLPSGSERPDVLGLWALVAGDDVEADALVLVERLVAVAAEIGVVDEDVLAATVRGDETKPLFAVEPLDGSFCHRLILRWSVRRATCAARVVT